MMKRLLFAVWSTPLFLTLLFVGAAPATAQLVINEIHADPDVTNGDANNDGTVSSDDDEFVEIVNTSGGSLDISNYTVSDSISVRHTFPNGTVLASDQAIVVFGGGTPTGSFGGSIVQTTGTLGLNNSGDVVRIRDAAGVLVAQDRYNQSGDDAANDDQSITRDPDVSGNFIKHTLATGASGALFSPGTRVDGSAFGAVSPTVQFEIASDTKTEGDSDSLYVIVLTLTNADNNESVAVDVFFDSGASSPTATSADINGFTSESLSLGPGSGSETVTFLITGDDIEEPAEDFVFALDITDEVGGVVLGSPETFTLTINDDDGPPIFENTLVITEFMANPAAVSDPNGEWVEVFNNTEDDIDLESYRLADSVSDSHVIATSVLVPPGEFAVLCRNGELETNGGVSCDYEYAGFTLLNGDDEIFLFDDLDNLVDEVIYTIDWVGTGFSTAYAGSPNGDNAVLANWAFSIAREGNFDDVTPLGDDGSPGTDGSHGNVAAPFGVAASAYCYAQASGDWSEPTTWANCPNGVPGEGEAAAILDGVTVDVTSATPSTGSAAIVVVEHNGTLNVADELNADVVSVAGDLEVRASGALNVGRDLSVLGTLITNDAVKLTKGAVAPATLTNEFGFISGTLTAERAYSTVSGVSGAGSFRGIFPPLEGVTFDQLTDDFQTQGGIGSEFPDATPTLYRFDAPEQSFIPITDYTNEFSPDSGYVFYMFDFDIPSDWDVTGTQRDEYDIALHFSDNEDSSDDFNWVPQPFAGTLDFDEAYFASEDIVANALNGTVYVLDPATEEFATYNVISGIGGSTRYVAPFQSFVVQTAADGASLIYDYDIKDTVPSPLIVGRQSEASGDEIATHIRFRLEGSGESGALSSDQTYLVFYPEGEAGYDAADASMLYPFASEFATLVLVDETGQELSMDARSSDLTTEQFRARIATTETGTFTLSWPTFHEVPAFWNLTLFDTLTDTRVDLRTQSDYTFDVSSATTDPRGDALTSLHPTQRSSDARFLITVSSSATAGENTGTTPDAFALYDAYPNPLSATATVDFALPYATFVNITVYDLLGRVVATLADGPYESGRHSATLSGTALSDGVYFIRMTADSFAATKKIVVLD